MNREWMRYFLLFAVIVVMVLNSLGFNWLVQIGGPVFLDGDIAFIGVAMLVYGIYVYRTGRIAYAGREYTVTKNPLAFYLQLSTFFMFPLVSLGYFINEYYF
jgi:hypothetical protein